MIWIILWHCYLEIDCRFSAKQSVMVINILQMICIGHVLEATGLYHPAGIVVESWVKNCTARFYNHSIGMRSYLPKNNFQFNLQKHRFVYVCEVLIKCYLNFIICLHFLLPLITWNSSHCHQMELSKESCKKIDSNNNWKTAWQNDFGVTSIFKIIIRICMKNIEFCRKTSKFLRKRCLFIFCNFHFLFKWKGVKPTSMSNKICRKWNF